MHKYLKMALRKTLGEDKGVTALEYAILAAAIATVVGTAVTAFGGGLSTMFTNLTT